MCSYLQLCVIAFVAVDEGDVRDADPGDDGLCGGKRCRNRLGEGGGLRLYLDSIRFLWSCVIEILSLRMAA